MSYFICKYESRHTYGASINTSHVTHMDEPCLGATLLRHITHNMSDITRMSSHMMHTDESCDTTLSHVYITQNELFIGATLLGHITHSMRDMRWLRLVDSLKT